MPTYYPENNTAKSTDGELRCLNKLVDLGAGAGSSWLHGNGDPNGVVTGVQGQTYYQDDATGTLWLNTDGGTTWVLVTTTALPAIVGAGDPNGVQAGTLSQFFIDMANPGHVWINVDGAMGWVLNA